MKDGKKTTEFWISLAVFVLGAAGTITGMFLGAEHWAVTAISSIVAAASGMGYTAARAKTKTAEAQLEAAKTMAAAPLEK